MNVWRLTTHHQDSERLLAWAKAEGRIAVGWNSLGKLDDYASPEEIKRAVRETGNRNWPTSGRQLWAFRHEMEEDDLVILSAGGARRTVVRVAGPYEFVGPQNDDRAYSHQRRVTATGLNADEVWYAAGELGEGQSIRWTLVRCAREVRIVDGRAMASGA